MNFKLDNIYIELFFHFFFPFIVMIFAIANMIYLLKKKERNKKYKRNLVIFIILYSFILIIGNYSGSIEKYIRLNYPNLYSKYIITVIDNKEYVVLQIIKNDYIIADIKRENKNLIIYKDSIKKYKFPGIMEFHYDSFDNIKIENKNNLKGG